MFSVKPVASLKALRYLRFVQVGLPKLLVGVNVAVWALLGTGPDDGALSPTSPDANDVASSTDTHVAWGEGWRVASTDGLGCQVIQNKRVHNDIKIYLSQESFGIYHIAFHRPYT